MTKIYLTWAEVEKLILDLLPQLRARTFDSLLLITRGGIIPAAIIAERLNLTKVLVASVDFYSAEDDPDLFWPVFMEFPDISLVQGEHVLVVDDLWVQGKEVTAVRERVEQAGGRVTTFVMHYKPQQSLFPDSAPDYYAAMTEDWVIYPWELGRAGQGAFSIEPEL